MPMPVILQNLVFLSNVLKAVIILIVVAICVAVGYVLTRVFYPRPALLSHTEDLKKYMKEYVEEVKSTSKLLLDELRKNPLPSGVSLPKIPVIDAITSDDITFFFMFYEYHTAVAKGLDTAWWFLKNEKFIIPKSISNELKPSILDSSYKNVDDGKMAGYVANKMKPIRTMAFISKKLTEYYAKQSSSSLSDRTALKMSAYRLNLLLNQYRDELSFMFDTRKTYGFVLQFNIFRLYLTDFADTIFNRKIKKDTWGNFFSEVGEMANAFTETYRSWQDWVLDLPFTLSDVDKSDERNDKEFENAEKQTYQKSAPSVGQPTDKHIDKNPDNEEMVIEGFKQIIDPIVNIMKFFVKAIIAIPKLIKVVFKILALIRDPPKFIQALLGLIIGIVIVIIYFIGLMMLSHLSWAVAFVAKLAISIFFTVLWLMVFIAVFILFVILWVFDLFTGGQVLRFLRCENLPNAWIYQSQYSFNNKFERSLLCSRPCFSGFKPAQLFCKKCKSTEPNFCPQQLVHQAFENRDLDSFRLPSKYLYKFSPSLALWTKHDREKQRELREFEKERTIFLASCYKSYQDQDHMTKTVCANIDMYFKPNSKLKQKVVSLCDQIYCDYGYRGGRSAFKRKSGEQELFCKTLPVIPEEEEDSEQGNIVTRTTRATVAILIVIVLLITLVTVSSHLSLGKSPSPLVFTALDYLDKIGDIPSMLKSSSTKSINPASVLTMFKSKLANVLKFRSKV